MKQLLFCLLLLPLCCHAQPGALGFGPLKINVTRLEELPALLGTKLYTYGDADFKKDQQLKELDSNWYNGYDRADSVLKSRFVKGYRIMKLADCKDGSMEIYKLELMFYKGVLIKISAPTKPTLAEWCKEKWGAPEDHSRYDTVACVNYYDGKNERNVNTEKDYTWRRGGERARYHISYTYDNDCRMRLWESVFVVEDIDAVKRYEALRAGKKQ
jgi:hypothetical protein